MLKKKNYSQKLGGVPRGRKSCWVSFVWVFYNKIGQRLRNHSLRLAGSLGCESTEGPYAPRMPLKLTQGDDRGVFRTTHTVRGR